jgi:hypothetical protein
MISRNAHFVVGSLVLAAALAVAAASSACAPTSPSEGHEGICDPTVDPAPAPAGVVATDVHDVPLDEGSARVTFSHKRDIDPVEDGCVGSVDVALTAAGSCTISLSFASSGDALALSRARFSADSDCPGWLDDEEGEFSADANPAVTLTGPSELPAENVDQFCLPFELALAGELSFYETDPITSAAIDGGRTLTMTLDGVSVSGAADSFGNEALTCVE